MVKLLPVHIEAELTLIVGVALTTTVLITELVPGHPNALVPVKV
jgi:hypothetical protein